MDALPRATGDMSVEDDDPNVVCRIGLIHGLVSRADLNGRLCRAVRWVPTKKRWALIVGETGEKVLVRDERIDFQAPEAISAELQMPGAGNSVVEGKPVASPPNELPSEDATATLAVDRSNASPFVQWIAHCFCLPVAPAAAALPPVSLPSSAVAQAK